MDLLLDLGAQPPANSLRATREQVLAKIPLAISRCRRCTTVQLTESISPEQLFRDYLWVTGTSATAQQYSHAFFANIAQRCSAESAFVVEVASNDGTILQRFRERGYRVLGIDPAQNLARAAVEAGIPTLPEFFDSEIAARIAQEHGRADVVIARNVLPHVPDPNEVIAGMGRCLKDDGLGAIEFHWVDKILNELHYDSIYHEHLSYLTLHSVDHLLRRHSLTLFDVTESPISGGSLVAYFSKQSRRASDALVDKLAVEQERGLDSMAAWQEFARRSLAHRIRFKEMIEAEVRAGKRLVGYGASARSSTLLNFCGIDSRHLICIADQNPLKTNLYTPGTDVLIVSPEQAMAARPDTVVLLAWNFKDEIMDDLADMGFRGKVLVPLPSEPKMLPMPQ